MQVQICSSQRAHDWWRSSSQTSPFCLSRTDIILAATNISPVLDLLLPWRHCGHVELKSLWLLVFTFQQNTVIISGKLFIQKVVYQSDKGKQNHRIFWKYWRYNRIIVIKTGVILFPGFFYAFLFVHNSRLLQVGVLFKPLPTQHGNNNAADFFLTIFSAPVCLLCSPNCPTFIVYIWL